MTTKLNKLYYYYYYRFPIRQLWRTR